MPVFQTGIRLVLAVQTAKKIQRIHKIIPVLLHFRYVALLELFTEGGNVKDDRKFIIQFDVCPVGLPGNVFPLFKYKSFLSERWEM